MKQMKFFRWISFACILPLCFACSKKEKQVEVFSESKPITFVIKKERSYFQAEKITNRLNKMGVEAYIITEQADDGEWYNVVSGAVEDSRLAVNAYMEKLDSLGMKNVKKLDYAKLDTLSRVPVVRDSVKNETDRIDANAPDVPENISAVVKKYPKSDMFYLQRIGIFPLTTKAIRKAEDRRLDLPRGIKLSDFQNAKCESFSSVLYEDNLFGDNVTLQIVKLKSKPKEFQASFVPVPNGNNVEALELCSLLCDKILETGEYENEKKEGVTVDAYTTLSGYEASFDDRDGHRSYFVLTDEAGEYVYLAQSSKKDNGEMLEFLAEIGKSDGLVVYDEFYNSFYTIADKQIDDDEFLGYFIDKLDWSYAESKNNADWAKKMVGHWSAYMYFDNKKKGLWGCMLTDLLTADKENYQYKKLYLPEISKDNHRKIYGNKGAAIYLWGSVEEVNFGVDRFDVAISSYGDFSERDLILRAEKLQFQRGGYSAN